MSDAREVFTEIRASNAWRGSDSVSGPGSSLKATALLRERLPAALERFGVRSLVDAPCGDLTWMRQLAYGLDSYVGVDIVPEIVKALRAEDLPGRRFELGDVATDVLSAADAVLCRDCLVHLPFELARRALANFVAAGFRYVLLTTFPGAINIDSRVGGWRPLDMTAEPFDLPPPLMLIAERAPNADDRHNSKSIGVWSAEQVSAALDQAPESADRAEPAVDRGVVFFTCADKAYEHFAPVYAASVLHHVETAVVELGLVDAAAFRRENPSIEVLDRAYPGRLVLRDVPWTHEGRRVAPNSVRFLQEPLTPATWTYVGDIDIIFLDGRFFEQHLPFMARTGLPYSNSVRPGTERLSGLHLVRSDAWYPLPSLDGLEPNHDEPMLYRICLRKGLPVQDAEWFRPVHGIHVSPNRPLAGWSVPHWREPYLRFALSGVFQAIRPLLQEPMRHLLDRIDDEVARPAALRAIERRLRRRASPLALDDYVARRQALISGKDYQAAAELGFRYLADHPDHAMVHHQTAWSLAALKLYPEAAEHQRRAVELAPGRADFRTALERLERAAQALADRRAPAAP